MEIPRGWDDAGIFAASRFAEVRGGHERPAKRVHRHLVDRKTGGGMDRKCASRHP